MTDTGNGSRRVAAAKLTLWAAALAPFLASVGFHAAGSQPAVVEPGAERPALAFDQYMVNLGKIEPQRYAFAIFRFTNRSQRTATVTELKPSCGCLQPRLEKRTYNPGETGEFFLRVQTANEQPGQKEYFVDLNYKDPQPRTERLTFKVELPSEKVVVRPKALAFYQFGPTPTEQEIFVTDFRQTPLNVVGVDNSSPLVNTAIGEVDLDEDGNRRTSIRVTVSGDVPAGRHQALVTIFTDDAVYSELRVPLLIQGRNSMPQLASPPSRRSAQ